MIRYALSCTGGHDFESWFRSSQDYDAQEKRGLLSCPVCGTAEVRRQIMAPQVARTDRGAASRASDTEAGTSRAVALIDPEAQALRQKIAALKAELLANSEDVGGSFAEEARKIHYGESDRRTIHGRASTKEARALAEEGVSFLPLPTLPDEHN